MGSGFIARVRPRASQTIGIHLGLSADITWMGKDGMCWGEVIPRLSTELATKTPPDILVLHLGGNDLGQVQRYKLLQRMKKDLTWVRETCPNTNIIFSSILPRIKWRYAKHPGKANRARLWINAEIAAFIPRLGGQLIAHSDEITHTNAEMFIPDGVHLSYKGNDLLLEALSNGIRTYL